MARIVYPTDFGDRPRSPLAIRKAAEWKAWVKVISPVVLQGRLPEPYYREWVNLVKAVSLTTDYSICANDIPRLRIVVARFVVHYEELYYQHRLVRLPACRAVFHALLHVADCMEWLGPTWPYAEWTMERMCGLWVPKAKLKQQTDQNFSLALLRDAQLHCLRYAANTQLIADNCDSRNRICNDPSPGDSVEDDIETGNICTSEGYTATLYSPVKEHLSLTLKDARLL